MNLKGKIDSVERLVFSSALIKASMYGIYETHTSIAFVYQLHVRGCNFPPKSQDLPPKMVRYVINYIS